MSLNININPDNPSMPRARELAMMLVTASRAADEPDGSGRRVFNRVISECATESQDDPEFQACLLVSLIRISNVLTDLAAKEIGITSDEVLQIMAPLLT